MQKLLTETRQERLTESATYVARAVFREAIRDAIREVEAEQSQRRRGGGNRLAFAAVGLAAGYLARNAVQRFGSTGGSGGESKTAPGIGTADEETEDVEASNVSTTGEADVSTTGDEAPEGGSGRGRRVLSRLFYLGALATVGYAVKRRPGSVRTIASKAVERARSVRGSADQPDDVAEGAEGVPEEVARMEEGSEQFSQRSEEGGDPPEAEGGPGGAGRADPGISADADEEVPDIGAGDGESDAEQGDAGPGGSGRDAEEGNPFESTDAEDATTGDIEAGPGSEGRHEGGEESLEDDEE